MLRSMFSGVSGLRSHQTMMDVVGNNIANVNTAGFKSASVVFSDTLSQLTKAAGAPQAGNGGTNPSQVGLGVRVNSISQNMTQGSAQSTGKATDLMINGDGMFVVKQGENTLYTRSGGFTLDSTGAITTAEGAYLQGWRADEAGNIDANAPTGPLIIPADTVMSAAATTGSTIKGNLDKSGKPVVDNTGAITSGPVIPTSFDVFDAQGKATKVTAKFTNAGTVGAGGTSYTPSDNWNVTFEWQGQAAGAPQTVAFGPDGKIVPGTPITFTFGTETIAVDVSKMTGFVSSTGNSSVSSAADGSSIGSLTGFAFGTDGVITGNYSNGMKRAIGQVAIATFNNAAGLRKEGNSTYSVSTNSGVPNVGIPGNGGRGTLGAGQLEMSNVDLSSEFTNLILAQRGFQANSRIISASDELLQDLVNLKR